MGTTAAGWTVEFRGCERAQQDCDAARFAVRAPQGGTETVEVRTTAQIEHILAGELGKDALDARERERLLSVAGRRLIEESLVSEGAVEPLLFLDSRLFRTPNAEHRLLQECGLLP